jgi:capsular polysaccharide biosynthesis protein
MSAVPSTAPRRRQVSLGPALRRRGWILPLTMIFVGALAYLIAGLQSATYSAEAVMTVTPALGSGPGSSSQATELAQTYANAIPRDDGIRRVVAAEVGRSAAQDSDVRASSRQQTAVLEIAFVAPDRGDARKGARAIAAALSSTRPISSSIAPGTLRVVQRPGTARRSPDGRWQSTGTLVVPAGGGRGSVVSADQANKLATSYAGLIAEDDQVIARTSRVTGLSEAKIRDDLSLFNDQNTAILRVDFRADTPEQATGVATTVARLVAGDQPVTAAVLPSSLEIVSLPRLAKSQRAQDAKAAIPFGVLLGLALGLVLLIAWERSNPHIAQPRDLSAQIGCPATPVDRLSPEAANALLERWASLADHVPARVAILPANEQVQAATEETVRFLLDAGGEDVGYEDRRAGHIDAQPAPAPTGTDEPRESVILLEAGPPGGPQAGEAVALESDLTVIVIPKHMTADDLRSLTEGLSDYGVVPVWALLTPTGRRASERSRRSAGAYAS